MNLASRIQSQISEYGRSYIQNRATDLMNARIRYYKPASEYDPVTRRNKSVVGELKYEGPARIWEVPGGQQIFIGEEQVVVSTTFLTVPFWVTPLPETDDIIVVLEHDDADLVGRTLNIDNVVRGGGLRASRRFQVTINTSKKATW